MSTLESYISRATSRAGQAAVQTARDGLRGIGFRATTGLLTHIFSNSPDFDPLQELMFSVNSVSIDSVFGTRESSSPYISGVTVPSRSFKYKDQLQGGLRNVKYLTETGVGDLVIEFYESTAGLVNGYLKSRTNLMYGDNFGSGYLGRPSDIKEQINVNLIASDGTPVVTFECIGCQIDGLPETVLDVKGTGVVKYRVRYKVDDMYVSLNSLNRGLVQGAIAGALPDLNQAVRNATSLIRF